MKNTIFSCILKLIYISFISIGNSVTGTNYCFIVGSFQASITKYKYLKDDFPERCHVIVYGNYIFDGYPTPIFKEDESAIKDLVNAQKAVYMVIGYLSEGSWQEILALVNQDLYISRKTTLIKALRKLSISGVLIDVELATLVTYAQNINFFINELKREIPTLKIGIPVLGESLYYEGLAPNFSITNNAVDFYVAKLFADDYVFDYKCGNVTFPSPNETVTLVFNQSGIDMKKTAGAWDVGVTKLDGVDTISQFCINNQSDWCTENIRTLYNDGANIKKYFQSLWIRYLDFDDFKGTCACRKFPATNTVMDGFEDATLVDCPKLNGK